MKKVAHCMGCFTPTSDEHVDLGSNVCLRFETVDGNPVSAFVRHETADGQPCGGWIGFREGEWFIHERHPLTLTPSLDCPKCPAHGFVRHGRWEPA